MVLLIREMSFSIRSITFDPDPLVFAASWFIFWSSRIFS
jgi:hypothetical protein